MGSARVCVQNIIIVTLTSLFCAGYGKYPELKLSNELINLDVDNITNNIFIGGKNVLLKVSPALAELRRITTGPKLDYVDCLGEDEPDCVGKDTDNKNKVLLVDSTERHLITCGSLKHGACQLRSLDSLTETNSEEFVVSNADLPAVALITPSVSGKRAIYIGTSWKGKYGKNPLNAIGTTPAVSTRKIDDPDVFAISRKDVRAMSFLQFANLNYLVKYIYGFSSGNFNYFVTVQETTESYQNKDDPKVFKTFIIRLCQRDIHYLTYVELPLECQSLNGANFSIAKSAHLTKPGDFLSKSPGHQASDAVLVVAFFETTVGWDGPSQNSAVCMYSVKEINTALESDQQRCVDGSYGKVTLGLPWVRDNEFCAEKVSTNFDN